MEKTLTIDLSDKLPPELIALHSAVVIAKVR